MSTAEEQYWEWVQEQRHIEMVEYQNAFEEYAYECYVLECVWDDWMNALRIGIISEDHSYLMESAQRLDKPLQELAM